MKKNKKNIFIVLAMVTMMAIGVATVSAEPAVVIIGEGICGGLDGAGKQFTSSDVHLVITNSRNGNVILKCKAKGVPNDTGKAVHWDAFNTGFPCLTLVGGPTNNWHETVSASGNATVTCILPEHP